LGAHDRAAALASQGAQLLESGAKLGRTRVVGIRAKRLVPPERVGRGLLAAVAASAEGRHVAVGYSRRPEIFLQRRTVELRVGSRAGEGADVGQQIGGSLTEEGDELRH